MEQSMIPISVFLKYFFIELILMILWLYILGVFNLEKKHVRLKPKEKVLREPNYPFEEGVLVPYDPYQYVDYANINTED